MSELFTSSLSVEPWICNFLISRIFLSISFRSIALSSLCIEKLVKQNDILMNLNMKYKIEFQEISVLCFQGWQLTFIEKSYSTHTKYWLRQLCFLVRWIVEDSKSFWWICVIWIEIETFFCLIFRLNKFSQLFFEISRSFHGFLWFGLKFWRFFALFPV